MGAIYKCYSSSNMIKNIWILLFQLSLVFSYHLHLDLDLDPRNELNQFKNQNESAAHEVNVDFTMNVDAGYSILRHCDFGKILRCTGKVTEAIAQCRYHPDITKCIEEILGANSECKECIKSICKRLHIHGCQ